MSSQQSSRYLGNFNIIDKKRARGLRKLRNKLKAKETEITFWYVKNYVSELKENAINYYKTAGGGAMQKNSVTIMEKEFLKGFEEIVGKYHAGGE